MATKRYLGEFEQMVLLAALHLKEDAYGVRLTEEISERSGREVSRGATRREISDREIWLGVPRTGQDHPD